MRSPHLERTDKRVYRGEEYWGQACKQNLVLGNLGNWGQRPFLINQISKLLDIFVNFSPT